MFNLVYRDGAPENAGHYEAFKKEKNEALYTGQLVSVTTDTAAVYESGTPYGVVARDARDGEDEVVVLRITKDMIFRVGTENITTTIAPNVKKGAKCIVSDEAVTNTGDGPFEITEIVKEGTEDESGDVKGMILEGRFADSN